MPAAEGGRQMKLSKLAVTSALMMALGTGGAALAQQAKPAGGDKGAAKAPAAGASASQGGGDDNVQYKAKTVYDFEDDMVEGDLQRPDGELIDSVRKAKHSSLIEIRKDFIPEMLKSLEDV
jgi:hypothetical protein